MKKLLAAMTVFVILILCMLCSCTKVTGDEDEGKLKVVVTAFVHYDFVRQIADDNVELTMLLKPGAEMHSYDPTPSDMAKISSCDVFVYTGAESDGWVKGMLASADNKNMKTVAFSEICEPILYENDGQEHSADDGHNHTYDEHVWTSPVNAMRLAKEIYDTLCEADPENADSYSENYNRFYGELASLDELFRSVVSQGVRNEVVFGDRFPFTHLVNEYGIEYEAAFPGCSSESEPSAATVAKLHEKVKNENIPVVFTIEFSNKKVAKSITEGTEAEILTFHSCHSVTNDGFLSNITYVELMTQNAENLRKALN